MSILGNGNFRPVNDENDGLLKWEAREDTFSHGAVSPHYPDMAYYIGLNYKTGMYYVKASHSELQRALSKAHASVKAFPQLSGAKKLCEQIEKSFHTFPPGKEPTSVIGVSPTQILNLREAVRKKVPEFVAFNMRQSVRETLDRLICSHLYQETPEPEEKERNVMSDDAQEAQKELPRYQCHKKVWALKIKEVVCHTHECPDVSIEDFAATPDFQGGHLIPEDESYAPIPFDAEYYRKHKPQAGGYYVMYEDGYESWSPADAFEGGYSLI